MRDKYYSDPRMTGKLDVHTLINDVYQKINYRHDEWDESKKIVTVMRGKSLNYHYMCGYEACTKSC